MKFLNIFAYPIYPDSIVIQWEIDNTQLNGIYTFDITINNDLYKSGPLYNESRHVIRYIPLLSHCGLNDLNFKIKLTPPIIDKPRGIDIIEVPFSIYHGLDEDEFNIASEINRKETLLFERKIGIRFDVYKRRKYGIICEKCTDKATGATIDSNCPICFGTKYGFYKPVTVWADLVEMPMEKVISEVGTTENKRAQVRLTTEILVSKHDILVDRINNQKWDISDEPTYTKFRSYPVGQQTIASLISPKSILQNLRIF